MRSKSFFPSAVSSLQPSSLFPRPQSFAWSRSHSAVKIVEQKTSTFEPSQIKLTLEPVADISQSSPPITRANESESISTIIQHIVYSQQERRTVSPFSYVKSDQNDTVGHEDSVLNRSSVLFVAVSFILLMVISLAWLIFYYVQRFRYLNSKERTSRRLAELARKAVARIPSKVLRAGDEEINADGEHCTICIEPFHPFDNIRIMPCRHYFHKICIDPWLLEQRSCPICKLDILQAFGLRPPPQPSARQEFPPIYGHLLAADDSGAATLNFLHSPTSRSLSNASLTGDNHNITCIQINDHQPTGGIGATTIYAQFPPLEEAALPLNQSYHMWSATRLLSSDAKSQGSAAEVDLSRVADRRRALYEDRSWIESVLQLSQHSLGHTNPLNTSLPTSELLALKQPAETCRESLINNSDFPVARPLVRRGSMGSLVELQPSIPTVTTCVRQFCVKKTYSTLQICPNWNNKIGSTSSAPVIDNTSDITDEKSMVLLPRNVHENNLEKIVVVLVENSLPYSDIST